LCRQTAREADADARLSLDAARSIVPPSHIATNSNYYLFKSGIKPAWEDSANTNGGKWAVQLPRDKNRDTIDKYWLYTVRPTPSSLRFFPWLFCTRAHADESGGQFVHTQMLAAIGETFETPHGVEPSPDMPFTDEVTGVIVSSRKAFYRISIWTRSAESLAKVGDIGKHFKHGVLGVQGKINVSGGLTSEVEFQSHRDSQVRGKKPAFTA
jgi:translation initiation factor 4E